MVFKASAWDELITFALSCQDKSCYSWVLVESLRVIGPERAISTSSPPDSLTLQKTVYDNFLLPILDWSQTTRRISPFGSNHTQVYFQSRLCLTDRLICLSRIHQAWRFAWFAWAGLIRLEWFSWSASPGLIRLGRGAWFASAGLNIQLKKIRHTSNPDPSCSGKSGHQAKNKK